MNVLQFEQYRWRPCDVTWNFSRTVVVIKLRQTSALFTSVAIKKNEILILTNILPGQGI